MNDSKTILITGATDGIWKQTALELAHMGHHIIVHGRSAQRTDNVVQEIQRTTKNPRIDSLIADFTSLDDVSKLAAKVQQKYDRLDILINNAGVYMTQRVLTPDGYETTFAVNHLAHFLLTNLLLDLIKANAPARIITVSSGTHRSGQIQWDNLQGEKHYSGYDAYSRSKLANVLFAYELASRSQGSRVTSNALHPGVIHTKLLKAGWGGGGDNLARGAETIVYAATAPELEGVTGRYFDNRRETESSSATHDKMLRRELWNVSARLVGSRTSEY
jgi:NAD(P)-dependent dehydrogenase (short-subunit alcohol dehydrogenase family)